MDYDACLLIICNALASIGPATAAINEQWSKFFVHGVSTYTTMTEIRKVVEMQNENLILGQTPQCLLPKETVEKKESSTVVLALIGKVTMLNIRIRSLFLGILHAKSQSTIYMTKQHNAIDARNTDIPHNSGKKKPK
jgi:hypothetical protein